jgi:hypothetical protein
MIPLHPTPHVELDCPHCEIGLSPRDWYIPGMRCLALLRCVGCGREYYGDLPAAGGLYYPMLLDTATGEVHDPHGVPWFADWLRTSYARRVDEPVAFQEESLRPLRDPVLLNCLDTLYGHCLLKLLNAQYYLDRRPDLDLVVLVPRFLRWMVPSGVAAVWTVDLPLRQGTRWNDWLAREIRRRLAPAGRCHLSTALSHPHPEDFDIERFTRVPPFPLHEWQARLDRPVVTFIWREDRPWAPVLARRGSARPERPAVPPNVPLASVQNSAHLVSGAAADTAHRCQLEAVITLARVLRKQWPALDFALAGLGKPGGAPPWIEDLRQQRIDDDVEALWCRRAAASHIVIGVHGSNLLLPSAHAGAVINLMPPDRWRNIIQDVLPRPGEPRETLFLHRFLPLATGPIEVARVASAVLREYPHLKRRMCRPDCAHTAPPAPGSAPTPVSSPRQDALRPAAAPPRAPALVSD